MTSDFKMFEFYEMSDAKPDAAGLYLTLVKIKELNNETVWDSLLLHFTPSNDQWQFNDPFAQKIYNIDSDKVKSWMPVPSGHIEFNQ